MKKFSLLFVAGLGSTASAGAFGLNEFDARAVGRGDATSATDAEPSSIFYNVGGLAVADGIQLQLGASIVAPFATFNHADGTKTDSNTGPQPLPAFFASARVHDMVSVGIGFTTPFGLALSWPDNSPTNDELHKQSLRTFFITPAVGLNLHKYVPGLTVGGGVDIVPATVELDQDVYFGATSGTVQLGGTGFGVGGRVGAMYRPEALPELSIGAMWRSAVDVHFTGTGDFDAPDPYRSQLPPDGDIKTDITMPMQVLGGVAYRPMPQLELEANVIWTQWSSFKTLDIEVPSASGTGTMTISTDEEYDNTVSVRGGVERTLAEARAAL
ncbi:MAG: outer membrane protein transport protein, partial [Kofleriaceae bacterium]